MPPSAHIGLQKTLWPNIESSNETIFYHGSSLAVVHECLEENGRLARDIKLISVAAYFGLVAMHDIIRAAQNIQLSHFIEIGLRSYFIRCYLQRFQAINH